KLALATAFSASLGAPLALPAHAVEAAYEPELMRLAELLGSLHYLRDLCGDPAPTWRDQMEALLTSENPPPDRRARLVARFNSGFRSFDSIYTSCTPSAVEAIERYMLEGETLSRDIATKFGN